MTTPVITFYSYKGGVGRTQALANMAVLLANRGKNVIVVDMDLESPGVHAFFSPPGGGERTFQERDFADRPGLIEYLGQCAAHPPEEPSVEAMLVGCTHRFLLPSAGTIRLLAPGRLDDTYVERLAGFSWERFYAEQHGYAYVEVLRRQLCGFADVVLVDSRTGLTDAGMVCTFQLPDLVVVMFALHRQGIEGAERMARAIVQRRDEERAGHRARRLLLLPTRVEEFAWTGGAEHFLSEARRQLGSIPHCELLDGLGDRIPYLAAYAHGENIVDPQADNHLSAAYARLADRLEGALDASPAAKPDDERPLLAAMDRESTAIRQSALALSGAARVARDQVEAIADLARVASDLLNRQGEATRRIATLNDILGDLLTAIDAPLGTSMVAPPRTIAEWESLAESVLATASAVRATLFTRARQRIRTAASDDASVVNMLWPEVQESLEAATAFDMQARLASFEAIAKRNSLDAQLQRGVLTHDALAGRYRTADERAQWLDERIRRFMDQGEPTPESADLLANLLRLRVADRQDKPLTLRDWSSYDVLCLLVAHQPERSDVIFHEIGMDLWSDAWSTFFREGGSPPHAAAGVECQKQLERAIATGSPVIAPLVGWVAAGIERSWAGREEDREWITRLLSDQRPDPCLRAAMAHLAEKRDDLVDLYAVWVAATAPLDAPAFRSPLRRVLEHLVRVERAGEAYYGLMAASSQDRTILDDRSFFFVLVALVQDSVDAPQRAPSLAGLLYNVGFAERIGATLQGTALLLLVALGLDVRERSPHVRNAARDALTVATIHGPPELEALRALPVFDDPSYAAATLEVAKILSDLSAESGRPIHSSWHLHSIYEAELQKFFAAELRRIQGTVITPNLRLSLQLSCDEWVRQAHGLIAQDHFGEPPRGAAYDKIQEIFGNAGGLLTELTRRCSQTARGRTIGQVAQDAPLVRSARAAMSAWLTAMGGPAWLVDPIRARVAEVNA